jgi:hypothetical protein
MGLPDFSSVSPLPLPNMELPVRLCTLSPGVMGHVAPQLSTLGEAP